VQIYNQWHDLKEKYKNIVVGLGNFDGVHLGHRKLIGDLVARAAQVNGVAAVFTFSPHPMAVLNPEAAPPMLLLPSIKRAMFNDLGVELLILVPFTPEFAQISPEDFVHDVLFRHLGVNTVLVGYNYTFGHRGRGTPELLQRMGRELGFAVEVTSPVTINGQPVSSTLIRNLIADGAVQEASQYLGYCPVLEGEVVYGERRGSQLGFPTANVETDARILIPANGVYSVNVQVDGRILTGVANIGVKPTFHGEGYARTIEVHVLDFNGDLYGKRLQVAFIRRLREEKRFLSVEQLLEQIRLDISQARGDVSC